MLHDISVHLSRIGFATASYACRLLFDSVAADKLTPKEKYSAAANIGAFQINSDTKKYVYNIFSSLFLPWGVPVSKPWHELVPKRLIETYSTFFLKHYGAKYSEMFDEAHTAQAQLYKEITFFVFAKILIRQYFQGLYKQLAK